MTTEVGRLLTAMITPFKADGSVDYQAAEKLAGRDVVARFQPRHPAQAGDIAQSPEIGGAMLSLRAFMFDRVYLGPQSAEEHARINATIRRIFEQLVERGDDLQEATDYLAGMTDRFALAYAAELD